MAGMLKKFALMLGACLVALFLTGCGEPSTDGASKLALQITQEMYKGNIQPLIEHLDYSKFDSEFEKSSTKEALQSKLGAVLKLKLKVADFSGGVQSFEVKSATEEDGIFKVVIKVTFGDGSSEDSAFRLRWVENKKTYLLID